jgi:large conductance mechanosensitive channel
MNGFRDFLLRGNLIELAVAFIMGVVFAAVVEAFTRIILDILGADCPGGGAERHRLRRGQRRQLPDRADHLPADRVRALRRRGRALQQAQRPPQKDEPEKAASSEDLLAEIRDLLRQRA